MGDRRISALLLEIAIDVDGTDAPWITLLTPNNGCVGDTVTIDGTGFEAAQGTGGVTINGTSANIVSWSDTQIVVTVAAGTTTGNLTVTTNSGLSDSETFTVKPKITLLNPNHGNIGDNIVITGTTFGAVQGLGSVTINGTAAAIVAWADLQITVTVAAGTTTGNVVVTDNAGQTSAGVAYTVEPEITNVTPGNGQVGDPIVIDGTDFGAAQGTGGVTFNGTAAVVTAWGDLQITVTVPAGATTGDIVVTNNDGEASAGWPFTVDPTPFAGGGWVFPDPMGPAAFEGGLLW